MKSDPGTEAKKVSFWQDLKQRNVYRIGVGYAAVAWFVIEVSETILPRIGLPDWSVTMVIVLALVGYPIALFLSWVFQITPDGIVIDRPRRPISWRTYLIIDLFIAVILVSAGSIYWFRIHQIEYNTDRPDNSIAVLSFVNIGEDPDNAAFSQGLSDELLTLLSRIEELKVSSRTASDFFLNNRLPFPEMSKALGARYLVEGSVQKEAERLRVTIQLIDGDINDHVWAENYEAPITGLLDLRSRMAADILEGLKTAISIKSVDILAVKPTDNAQAYVFYLQGQEYLRRPRTDTNLNEAARLFSNAEDLDPRFASAHAGLCQTFLARFSMQKDPGWFEKAERSCHRTLTLDPQHVDVYVALGELYRLSSQYDEALEYFDLALKVNPDSVEATMDRGITLDHAGQTGEAEHWLVLAVQMEPFYWRAYNSLGRYYMRHARYIYAVEQFEKATEISPDNVPALNNLAAALYMNGHIQEAINAFDRSLALKPSRSTLMNIANLHYYQGQYDLASERYRQASELAPKDDRTVGGMAASLRFVEGQQPAVHEGFVLAAELVEKLLEVSPTDALAWARLASYQANLGNESAAIQALEQAGLSDSTDPEVWFFACLTYMPLGRHEEALALVEKLVEQGYPKDILSSDPDLEPIRGDDRFTAMLSKVN